MVFSLVQVSRLTIKFNPFYIFPVMLIRLGLKCSRPNFKLAQLFHFSFAGNKHGQNNLAHFYCICNNFIPFIKFSK